MYRIPAHHETSSAIHFAILAVLTLGLWMTAGCRREAAERKYHAVSGIAESIDVNTGRVAMSWRKRPNDEPMEFFGHITQETEIFINGISAGVQEVKIGDPVEVTVYLDGDIWIVTRVAVTRREDYMLNKSLEPATDSNSVP